MIEAKKVVSTKRSYGLFLRQMAKRYKFDIYSARPLCLTNVAGPHGAQASGYAASIHAGILRLPRRVSLASMAEQLGCAPSTLDEILRRGGRSILRDFLNVQEGLILPAVSPNQTFVSSSNPADDEFVTRIFEFDNRIRLCMIIGPYGRRIAGGMRRGVESLEPSSKTAKLQRDEIITRRMDEAWNLYFGRTNFTIEQREKVLIINFYLPDSRTIVVTAERESPIQKLHPPCELVNSLRVGA